MPENENNRERERVRTSERESVWIEDGVARGASRSESRAEVGAHDKWTMSEIDWQTTTISASDVRCGQLGGVHAPRSRSRGRSRYQPLVLAAGAATIRITS